MEIIICCYCVTKVNISCYIFSILYNSFMGNQLPEAIPSPLVWKTFIYILCYYERILLKCYRLCN